MDAAGLGSDASLAALGCIGTGLRADARAQEVAQRKYLKSPLITIPLVPVNIESTVAAAAIC